MGAYFQTLLLRWIDQTALNLGSTELHQISSLVAMCCFVSK